MEPKDYKNRSYLSSIEAAKYLAISVDKLHELVNNNKLEHNISASGQKRFELLELQNYENIYNKTFTRKEINIDDTNILQINGTEQRVYVKNSMDMADQDDDSVHLMVTSPPYFNTKMYSREPLENDLGDIHNVDDWFKSISQVWSEVYRVLQPGRKAFINIMNLPVRLGNGGFRTLNLVGRTIDECEKLGFIFKRDIIWHKTNAVKAHFGTYPYPGGILLNNMHEFILEFDKPAKKGTSKYSHLTKEQREGSKLDKEFWLTLKKSDVWLMAPQGSSDRRKHIAPFPLELPSRLVKAFSFIGETVLDPFMGSGTTLMAASELNRNGVGYELNKDIAADAINSLLDQKF
jgi:DNA modification methylase